MILPIWDEWIDIQSSHAKQSQRFKAGFNAPKLSLISQHIFEIADLVD